MLSGISKCLFNPARILFDSLRRNFPQLTLFPRVSETSKTNLRNQRLFLPFSHVTHPLTVL